MDVLSSTKVNSNDEVTVDKYIVLYKTLQGRFEIV